MIVRLIAPWRYPFTMWLHVAWVFEFAIHKMKPRFARTFTDKLRGTKTMLLGGRPALDLVCRHVVHEHRSLTWHKGLLHDKGGQKGGRDDDARGLWEEPWIFTNSKPSLRPLAGTMQKSPTLERRGPGPLYLTSSFEKGEKRHFLKWPVKDLAKRDAKCFMFGQAAS